MEKIAAVTFFEGSTTNKLRNGQLTREGLARDTSQTVGVKHYHYIIPQDMELSVGNIVYAGWDNLAIVREIFENSIENMSAVNLAKKDLIARVDLKPVLIKAEKLERKKYLKNQIEKMKANFEEYKFLQMMSESDPDAKKLIEEYKELAKLGGE